MHHENDFALHAMHERHDTLLDLLLHVLTSDYSHLHCQDKHESASSHWQALYPRQDALEFDRQRKLMSVCCQHEGHHLIFTKGAPENLLPRCTFAIDESGQASIEMSDKLRREWTRVLDQWGGDSALRCVGLAYSAVPDNRARLKPDDESDLVFLGILGLQDPPRPEVADAMQTCFGAGIRVVMLTGAPPAVSPPLPPLPPPQLLLRLPPTQPAPLLPLHTQATPVCTCPQS